ncbi:MAG: hypothetical protein AB7H48_05865 [Parachlamydiales bacterium]
MSANAVSPYSPESFRLDPSQQCLYDFIQADELLLTLFLTAIRTMSTPAEAKTIWNRLSVVDRKFHFLSNDTRITLSLLQCNVEVPTRILLRCIPIKGSQPIIEEAWRAKHERMLCLFWNSKCNSFYALWAATLPRDVRNMVTSVDMTVSRKPFGRQTFEDFARVVMHMPHLEKLILRRCAFVDDRCLEWIAIKAPSLKILDLHTCALISNRGIISLMYHCQYLEELNLSGCRQIGADGFSAIGLYGKKICKLYLNETKLCFDKLQQVLEPRGHQLELLSLSQCAYLATDSLGLVARHCTNLKTLFLDGCLRVNERGLVALSKGCDQLESIHLSLCLGITYRGLHAFLLSKPHLQSLLIHYCHLTYKEHRLLQEEFPRVNINWHPFILSHSRSTASSSSASSD